MIPKIPPNRTSLGIMVFLISILSVSMTKYELPPINMKRGLESSIADFNDLEQKLIRRVAEKLEENGYSVHQLTRIHLNKRIDDLKTYYSNNEVTFLINPGIYEQGIAVPRIQNISVGWEDASVIRHPDGGIEFVVGEIIKVEDLTMNLYGLIEHYASPPLIQHHDPIVQQLEDILIATDLEEIQAFASIGIMELIENYEVLFRKDRENDAIYYMSINRLDDKMIDSRYFSTLYRVYKLKINTHTRSIEILDSFDPTLFPTPVSQPGIIPDEPLDDGN